MSDTKYITNKGEPIHPIKARVMNFIRITPYPTIKCPCCGKDVVPEVINSRGNISVCPLCRTKITG